MKKLIVLSLLTAVMLLGGSLLAPAQAQSPANDLKPTFISPTPGLYVNGWPAFYRFLPQGVGGGAALARSCFCRRGAPTGFTAGYLTRTHDCCPCKPSPLRGLGQDMHACLATDRHGHQGPLRQTLPVEGWHPGPGGRSRICPQIDTLIKNGPKFNDFVLVTKKDLTWVVIH